MPIFRLSEDCWTAAHIFIGENQVQELLYQKYMIQSIFQFFLMFSLFSMIQSSVLAEPLTPESLAPQFLTHAYKYDQMADLLSNIRSLNDLPDIQTFDQETSLTGQPVDTELKTLFGRVQKAIFEQEIVALALCSDCHFRADYGSRKIFLNMESVLDLKNRYRDWREILTYILAHETSHLVQYMSCHTPYSTQEGSSLNGLTLPCAEQWFTPDKAAEATRGFLHFHAETDVYATLALIRSGFNSWTSVLSYLNDEARRYETTTPNGFVTAADFRNRGRAIQKLLLSIQENPTQPSFSSSSSKSRYFGRPE